MQTKNMESFGLTELDETSLRETNGGVWWLPAALVVALVVSAVDNFGDIREGLADGWNGKARH